MTIRNWLISGLLLFLLFFHAKGQSITSPYSSFGLGEITPISYAHNEGMGGLGVGMPSVYFVNNRNAAWLPYNLYTSFQVGVKSDFRSFAGTDRDVSDQTGSVEYISFSFPVINSTWGTHFTLSPFSSVNYDVTALEPVQNSENFAISEFSGSGGLTQLKWSNGVKVYKNLNLGLSASYVFGKINRTIENLIIEADSTLVSDFRASYTEDKNYSDVTLTAALGHRIFIDDEAAINYGITYRLSGNLEGERDVFLERKFPTGGLIQSDAVIEGQVLQTDLPNQLDVGVSYEKINAFAVGLDIGYGFWKGVEGLDVSLRNALTIGTGVRWTPDYKSVTRYFDRVMYRFGAQYKEVPYIVNGTEISDFGINFGASFPVSGLSSIDTAFKIGTRGTTDNSLVQETYFQFTFGLTINDRWFIKRRYD